MGTYEVIKELCDERKIAVTKLEQELGFGRGSIGKLRNSDTSGKRLQKIADYFNVSLDYLQNGEEPDFNTMYLHDTAFELYLKQIGWNTKYLSGGIYDISNGQVSVNISDDEFHRFESEIRHRCNEKIRGFINNSLDSNMPIAAHERTDTEVTDEMAESDLEKMDF